MKLSELLQRLSIDYLAEIAMNCGIVCGRHSKRQLIRAILDNFRRTSFLAHILRGWTVQQRHTLTYLLITPDEIVEDSAQPQNRSSGESAYYRSKMDAHSNIIQAHGFLLPVDGRASSESTWVIPDDLKELLKEVLGVESGHPPEELGGEPEVVGEHSGRLIEDLYRFLIAIYKEPLRVKQYGDLHKRAQDRLAEALQPFEDPVLDSNKASIERRIFRSRDYAESRQMIKIGDGVLRATGNLHNWMEKPDEEKQADLFKFISRERREFSVWPEKILRFLEQTASKDGWYEISEPIRYHYGRSTQQFWWEESARIEVHNYFQDLYAMGCVQLGHSKALEQVVFKLLPLGRWLILGDESPHKDAARVEITVQPDFEVFLNRDVPLSERWELEQMADIQSEDVVLKYRIEREAVYRGLRWGHSVNEMIAFLEKYTHKQVPQNVLFSLQNWGEQYGDVSFADVLLLRCRDERIAQEIRMSPQISKFIQGSITDQDLIISRKDYEQVLRLLRRNGYMPKPKVVKFDREEKKKKGESLVY